MVTPVVGCLLHFNRGHSSVGPGALPHLHNRLGGCNLSVAPSILEPFQGAVLSFVGLNSRRSDGRIYSATCLRAGYRLRYSWSSKAGPVPYTILFERTGRSTARRLYRIPALSH